MRYISFLLTLLLLLTMISPPALATENTDLNAFSSTDYSMNGEYISFSLNDDLRDLPLYLAGPDMSSDDVVTSLYLMGTPLFSSISFSAMGNVTLEQLGNSFVLDGTGGRLEIHDNPSGTLIFNAHNEGRLDLTTDKGISLRVENNTVLLDRQGTLGRLFISSGTISVSGQTITLSLENNSRAAFRALPYLEYSGGEAAVMSSILSGKISGELYISREADLVKDDYSEFGSTTARTSMVRSDRIGAAANAGNGGKIILIHIPTSMMKETGAVIIDGKEPAAAPSLSQMLDYSGSPNAYYVQHSGNYSTVMVYLSESGGHTIDIKEKSDSTLSAGDYLTMSVGASFVVLAALLLYRRV